jgi:quercetin dioxygenase-like cupin family protein
LSCADLHDGRGYPRRQIAFNFDLSRRPWERHDGGDELLVPIMGSFTVTLRRAGSDDQIHHAGPGEVVLIPRGVAHSFKLHAPEVQLLFVTPRHRNTGWSDTGECRRRHD